MAASKEGLIDNINCKLTTGGLTDIQASQLAGAAQALCCSSFYAVACEACLPNAALNKGRFVYVQDVGRYRYSDGLTWTSEYCSAKITENLWTWGSNTFGELGNGTTTSRSSPGTTAGGGANWLRISAGKFYLRPIIAALKTDGTLWSWGYNDKGQLGDGTVTSRLSPGTVAGGGTNWCQISSSGLHTTAIKTDGTLWTWGYNIRGQLGDGTTTSRSSPGTVAGGGTNWRMADAGYRHSVAIKTDGTLWTWGYNDKGQLGDGTVTSRLSPGTVAGGGTTWCAVSAGRAHTVALKTDGTLWTWGYNIRGQLGDGTVTSRSSPGTVAGGGTTWCAVSAGGNHATAIKTDGTLWTWGYNFNGVLGDGTVTNRSSPGTTAGGGTTWCAVSAGCVHSAAIKTDGTLWTWGCNGQGRLGDGTTTNRSSPGSIAGANIWLGVAVSAGHSHTAGIKFTSGF